DSRLLVAVWIAGCTRWPAAPDATAGSSRDGTTGWRPRETQRLRPFGAQWLSCRREDADSSLASFLVSGRSRCAIIFPQLRPSVFRLLAGSCSQNCVSGVVLLGFATGGGEQVVVRCLAWISSLNCFLACLTPACQLQQRRYSDSNLRGSGGTVAYQRYSLDG